MENKNTTKEKKTYSEKLLEKALARKFKEIGGLSIKLLSNHCVGLPDRLCLFPGGKSIFVELKTTGKKPRKIQELMHNKLRGLGQKVIVIDTLEQIKNIENE